MSIEFQIVGITWKWIMKIEDVKWSAKSQSSPAKNEAILMRNGTAKTTTLLLMQSLFTNTDLTESELLERAQYKLDRIKPQEVEPEFAVDIKIADHTWTLGYRFQTDENDTIIGATIFTNGPSGYEDGYHMPIKFSNAFQGNMHLAKLLFFDTQTAGSQGRRLPKSDVDEILKILSNIKILENARNVLIPGFLEDARKKAKKSLIC